MATATLPPLAPDQTHGLGYAVAPTGKKPKSPLAMFIDRYLPPVFITLILLVANWQYGVLEDSSYAKTGLAILTCILCEAVLGYLIVGKVPPLASSYISGISVGILVRSPFFWPYALCAAISIVSKYALRLRGRHLWNPSNFGMSAILLLCPLAVASLSQHWGNNLGAVIVIWCLGLIITWRVKRFHISVTYALSFVFFATIRHWITGHEWLTEVAPITGPMYQLFTFFMVTDPKTTVKSRRGQYLVVFLVAAAECVLRLCRVVHAPYFALFLVGPAANFVEIMMTSGSSGGRETSRPTTASAVTTVAAAC
jgi:hypothetical protein